MSVVIAIKDKDRFILGADKQVSSPAYGTKSHTGTKVWNVKGYEGIVMGGVGFARVNQIMQYADNLFDWNYLANEGLTTEYISKYLTATIIGILSENGFDCLQKSSEGNMTTCFNSFIIAADNCCWMISPDLTIEEISDYTAIGSGEDIAIASIETACLYHEKNPFKAIVNSIDIAAERTLSIDHEVDFVTTKPYETDLLDQLEALDAEEFERVKKEIQEKKKLEKESKKKAKTDEVESKEPADQKPKKEKKKKKQKLVEEVE